MWAYMEQMKPSSSNFTTCSIASELIDDFLSYSTAIFSRALPDCVDGLKTAQRRSLLGIKDLGLWSESPYCKVSRLEGHVLGRYHPNGGCANTIINLGQQSSQRYTLTDIHGNCGGSIQTGPCSGQKVSADGPAAARYLEVRATRLSEYLYLSQIDRGLGEWRPNYDGSTSEPIRIVPALPALLLTGSTGIAAGYAANHIPYNITDVISATISWISNPKITDSRLFAKFSSPPEPPQGGRVLRNEGLNGLMKTGKGQVEVYGKWEYEDKIKWGKRGHKPGIVVTHLASGSSEEFVEKVHELADKGKMDGLVSVADHSSRDGIRIEMIVKDEVHRDEIIRILIDSTGLRYIHNVNSTAVGINGKPVLFGIRQTIETWYEQRVNFLIQKNEKEVRKLQAEEKKLRAVESVITTLDKFLKVVRGAKDKNTAVESVCKGWKLEKDMAEHVLSIPISTLISTESDKIKEKLLSVKSQIFTLTKLCVSGDNLDKFIIGEVKALKVLASPPRSEWVNERPATLDIVTDQTHPLSGRDRVVDEAKSLGLSTRAINKWLKENVGQGVELRWQEYKNLLQSDKSTSADANTRKNLPKPRANRFRPVGSGKTPVRKRASGTKGEKSGSSNGKQSTVTSQARHSRGSSSGLSSGSGAAPISGRNPDTRKRRSSEQHRSKNQE